MAIEVRPALPQEHDQAGKVTAEAYREFVRPGDPGWEEYLARIADVRSRSERAVILVAVLDGRVVGSATLELHQRIEGGKDRPELEPGEAHLRMLGVDPGVRRRGIGRALVEGCIDEARRAGKTVLTLETTERMAAARRMYESMGFARGPDQVFDDGFRMLVYELALQA